MITLHKLAKIVGGTVVGAPEQIITGVSDIFDGAPNTITFLFNPKQKELIGKTAASAIIVSESELLGSKSGIVVENPRLAMAKVLGFFEPEIRKGGIHASVIIPDSAKLGKNVSIGAYTVIGENTQIENNVTIYNNVSIGSEVFIGEDTEIFPQVSIFDRTQIGKRVSIDMGTVIGSCGFGYETEKDIHHKIPQIGRVIIEEDVDIYANCTIDRGTIKDTIIGKGTKIDNLVQVAHNVKIGKGCLIAGQVGIAGSVTIGDYCIFGGQVGIKDGITIGDRAIFLAKTGITKSVEGGIIYSGNPCREVREANKRNAVYYEIQSMKKRLKALEQKLAG